MINVLIADDHHLVRTSIAHLLNEECDIKIVGEVDDGESAVSKCRQLRPDIVLMDIRMPVYDGLTSARLLKANSCTRNIPLIFLSAAASTDPNDVTPPSRSIAKLSGACGSGTATTGAASCPASAAASISGFTASSGLRRAEEPILPMSLFANNTFLVVNFVGLMVGMAMFGTITFLPFFLQVVKGISPTSSGLFLVPMMGGPP